MSAPRSFHLGCALLLLVAAGSAAAATEYGTIVSRTPVMGQVGVPERRCVDEPVAVPVRTSGAGAIVGAVVGGLVGSTMGGGGGRAAATAVGTVAGAAIGDHAEASNVAAAQQAVVQRCRTITRSEDRLVGYDVVYELHGVQRSARLPTDPGAPGTRIAVEVNVAPVGAATRNGTPVPPAGTQPPPVVSSTSSSHDTVVIDEGAPQANTAPPGGVYAPPPVVYGTPYPYYYGPGYYGYYGAPAIVIGARWGYGYGHWHGHGHW